MTYSTTLELTQIGRNGPITDSLTWSKQDSDYEPEAYNVMKQLAALWLNLHPHHEPDAVTEGDETWKATFTLSQEGPGEPVYSKMEFHPRLTADDEGNYPTAYGAMSYLATQYLIFAGVLSEEGDLLEPEKMGDTVVVSASSSIH